MRVGDAAHQGDSLLDQAAHGQRARHFRKGCRMPTRIGKIENKGGGRRDISGRSQLSRRLDEDGRALVRVGDDTDRRDGAVGVTRSGQGAHHSGES